MGRHSHRSARRAGAKNNDRVKKSKLAPLSVFFLLVNIFAILLLLRADRLITTTAAFLIAGLGYSIGRSAQRRIKRHHGVIQGHAAAEVGTYGNLAIVILAALVFIFELVRAVFYGDIEIL